MLGYADSPPSLRFSLSSIEASPSPPARDTAEPPVVIDFAAGKRSVQPYVSSPSQPGAVTTRPTSVKSGTSSLLPPNFDDNSFPHFGSSPRDTGMADVVGAAASARHTSTSPRGNQPSNLTSALRRSGSDDNDTVNGLSTAAPQPTIPSEDVPTIQTSEAGARPIAVNGRSNDRSMRRESIAQSLGMGMSWGGVSVENFVRDDFLMSGTSPFAFHQSPSYHSSSYLPKLEANFMRDFACCGLILPSLHELLQHYEEAHAQKDTVQNDPSQQPPLPDSRAAIAANTAAQIQQEAQQRSHGAQNFQTNGANRSFGDQNPTARPAAFSSTLQTIPDMDTVDDMDAVDEMGMDMDMDMDGIDPRARTSQNTSTFSHTATVSPTSQFPLKQSQIPQLNTSMMQGHQAYRNSTPTTPIASTRNSGVFQGSSASTTLMANPMQQFQDLQNPYRSTPDSSTPGTPNELDESLMAGMDDISMGANNPLFNNLPNGFGGFGFGTNNDMIDLCIDEPAKRLFQSNQGGNNQYSHNRLGSGQYGPNSDIAKRIREQQMLAGLPDTTTNIAPHEEPKPFRCPVIGCEKAYKNQNGLKYHKSHGHNNQRLHDNADGTFSIVDPDTQAPYPGTLGMEKEKPYKCDVCQKRYKNLNGLKYHKTHSPPCNPDLAQNQSRPNANMPVPSMMPGQGLNPGGMNIGGPSGDANMIN